MSFHIWIVLSNNVRICDVHVLLADTVNDTLQQMDDDDFNVDMFLIYEEMTSFNGKSPPTPRKDLCKFLHLKRKPFVKCFHLIAVNPTAQVYLARDLHNTVHGGLLHPGVEPFLRAIHSLGFHHVYYTASVPIHTNKFIQIIMVLVWLLNWNAFAKLISRWPWAG